MQKQKNKESGITLIALVVTVIVLIILAGVSISMLVGENGIITQVQTADEATMQAQQKEAIELAVASVQAQGTLELDKTKLEVALQSQLGDTTYTLTENGDGSFLLQIAERSYYIDSTGKVIAEENMIAIGSAEELKTFRDDVNSGNTYEGKYVYLTSDITLDINEEWEPIGKYDDTSTNPDDDINKCFMGIFDGKFYKISGVSVNSTEKGKGLFALVKNATIKNLGVTESNITGSSSTGAIVGYAYNNSSIYNCYNAATVVGIARYTGGIVGYARNGVKIESCYNVGTITSQYNAGGICGELRASQILNCYNTGEINGTATGDNMPVCGGITGSGIQNSSIVNTYNIGKITTGDALYSAAGIVVTLLDGTSSVENSYFLENIVNGGNGYLIKGTSSKTVEEMKQIDTFLGSSFKKDSQNINNGYPVLAWQ